MYSRVFQRNWQLFAVVVMAQMCDLATFLMGIARVGIHAEQNAIVRQLYLTFGASGPLLLKIFTLATVLPLLWLVAYRWQSRVLPTAFVATAIAMVGVYGNIAHGIIR